MFALTHTGTTDAKVIVHQTTRPEAICSMLRCLTEFVIEPIKTTLPFLRRVLSHPDFQTGSIDTGFVERTFDKNQNTE